MILKQKSPIKWKETKKFRSRNTLNFVKQKVEKRKYTDLNWICEAAEERWKWNAKRKRDVEVNFPNFLFIYIYFFDLGFGLDLILESEERERKSCEWNRYWELKGH